MKAGNEIKKGWEIIRCPICKEYLGFDPKDPKRNLIHDCPGRPLPEELSNAEFCKAVRNRIFDTTWSVEGERENYHILTLPKLLARLEKAEKKIKYYAGFVSPTSWRGVWYGGPDPATAPDVSVNVFIKRCPHCRGRGFHTIESDDLRVSGQFSHHCTHCCGTGYVVVGKGKTATRDSIRARCPECGRLFNGSIYRCCPNCGLELIEQKGKT